MPLPHLMPAKGLGRHRPQLRERTRKIRATAKAVHGSENGMVQPLETWLVVACLHLQRWKHHGLWMFLVDGSHAERLLPRRISPLELERPSGISCMFRPRSCENPVRTVRNLRSRRPFGNGRQYAHIQSVPCLNLRYRNRMTCPKLRRH